MGAAKTIAALKHWASVKKARTKLYVQATACFGRSLAKTLRALHETRAENIKKVEINTTVFLTQKGEKDEHEETAI